MLRNNSKRLKQKQENINATDNAVVQQAAGDIHNTFVLPEPPAPLTPAIHLPLRNVYFTGRKNIIDNLAQSFADSTLLSLTQTISGLGGVGKSQTAMEYAYQHQDNYSDAVWWINASSPLEDCRKLLIWFGFPDDEYDPQAILSALEKWYHSYDSWLLIFDNADDYSALQPFLPKGAKGHILITTRNKNAFIHRMNQLDLDVFSEEDALTFLFDRIKLELNEHAKMLVEQLGYLPLALEQAAAYMVETGIDYEEYLGLLIRNGLRLLEKGKPVDYDHVVTTTWQISMKKLSEAAKQLLYLCAYLAPNSIPIRLYIDAAEELPQPLQDVFLDELERFDAINELTCYSLLRGGSELFSMHRLVQQVVCRETSGDSIYLAVDLDIITDALPQRLTTNEHYALFTVLAPHCEAVLDAASTVFRDEEEILQRVAGGYHTLGLGYDAAGNFEKALAIHYKALAIGERVLEENPILVIASFIEIGAVYINTGDFEKALTSYEKALAIEEKVLEREHPFVAVTYNNIGIAHREIGDYKNALLAHEKALAIRKKVLGSRHEDTAQSYDNIGMVYFNMGEFNNALAMHEKAIAIYKKVLGPNHLSMVGTYNGLGSAYDGLGDQESALRMYKKALTICEKVLGPEHPSTAIPYTNIGGIYGQIGRYTEALEMCGKALLIREKTLGTWHPLTASSYNNIGVIYSKVEAYEDALEFLCFAFFIYLSTLDFEHPYTQKACSDLKIVYLELGNKEESFGDWLEQQLQQYESE